MKRVRGPVRKRPHILPPLAMIQGSVSASSPVDPLQPPQMVSMEPRFGSPTPRWHRPTADELEIFRETPEEGKPSIRVTFYDHEGNSADGTEKSSLDSDLRNDPHFKEDNSVLKGRRDSLKNFGSEDKPDRPTGRSYKDVSEDRPAWSSKGIFQTNLCKARQLPNRYAPLKPISKQIDGIKKQE